MRADSRASSRAERDRYQPLQLLPRHLQRSVERLGDHHVPNRAQRRAILKKPLHLRQTCVVRNRDAPDQLSSVREEGALASIARANRRPFDATKNDLVAHRGRWTA